MASDAGAALYDYLRVKHKVDKKLPSSEFPHPILKVTINLFMVSV